MWTKFSPAGGTKPPSTFSSFPFAAFDRNAQRVVLYAGNNDLWHYVIAQNAWLQIAATGDGPDYGDPNDSDSLANHSDGNMAAFDSGTNRLILMYPFPTVGQSGTPAIFDIELPFPQTTVTGTVKIFGSVVLH